MSLLQRLAVTAADQLSAGAPCSPVITSFTGVVGPGRVLTSAFEGGS